MCSLDSADELSPTRSFCFFDYRSCLDSSKQTTAVCLPIWTFLVKIYHSGVKTPIVEEIAAPSAELFVQPGTHRGLG